MDLLLYSQNQNCFHRETLDEHIKDNYYRIKTQENYDDYRIIYATAKWDDDRQYIDSLKKKIRPQ